MAKEWTTWGNYQAVKLLSESEVAALPKNLKVVGMRWVFTDKNERLRLPGTASASKAVWAKARLVVQGCQERVDIESCSPKASLTSIFLICALAAILHLEIGSADAESAYLQGEKIQRMLILRAPRPPPPGVAHDALFRACASIYGTKDAGRGWWTKLSKLLEKYAWVPSRFEKCLFFLFVANLLVGILATHVDDLFVAGKRGDKTFKKSWLAISVEIKLTSK